MNWYKIANEFEHSNRNSILGEKEVNTHSISIPSGVIRIMENSPYADGRNSVVDFVVDEDKRGRGVGTSLVGELMSHYAGKRMSAQVSVQSSYTGSFS